MKTTKAKTNIELAQEFLAIREKLKQLNKREKELKEYFSNLIDNDSSLLVGTSITISKHEMSRKTLDKKALIASGIDITPFEKTSTYNVLKIG